MKKTRRTFIKEGLVGSLMLGSALSNPLGAMTKQRRSKYASIVRNNKENCIVGTSTIEKRTTVLLKGEHPTCRVMQITDSHVTIPDAKKDSLVWKYCKRMHEAFKNTGSHSSGENISREEAFRMVVDVAKRENIDLLVLTGDIVNFPSEKTINYVADVLDASGIPYIYVNGNHDWELEGYDKSYSEQKQETLPLFARFHHGNNPMYSSTVVKGVNFVCIDDSTYEVNAEQVAFFKKQIEREYPIVLCMHIPVCTGLHTYLTMGDKRFGKDLDEYYEAGVKDRWGGEVRQNTPTEEFHRLLVETPNIITLCGHLHTTRFEREQNLFQIITGMAREGDYHILTFVGENSDYEFPYHY